MRPKRQNLCFGNTVLIIIMTFPWCGAVSLTDVSSEMFSGASDNILAAFVDFDGDKLTDMLAISKLGTQIDLLTQIEISGAFQMTTLVPHNHTKSWTIHNVVAGDFDSDYQMDLLVSRSESGENTVDVCVYWGISPSNVAKNPNVIASGLRDQPLVMDWNQDMIPDLLGESPDGTRNVWIFSENRTVEKVDFPSSADHVQSKFRKPHSNAFADITGDDSADLILSTEDGFEVWTNNEEGDWEFAHLTALPEDVKVIGQSLYIDLDQNNNVEHVLPVCADDKCEDSKILVLKDNDWKVLLDKFDNEDQTWSFVKPSTNLATTTVNQAYPITLSAGDVDMDGYPDLMALLSHTDSTGDKKTVQHSVILMNMECTEGPCSTFGRTFDVTWDSALKDVDTTINAAFFDLYENGIVDFLLVGITDESDGSRIPVIRAYKNTMEADACFVKIKVVNGRCLYDCPSGKQPYTANVPGPVLKYETTKPNGNPQKSTGVQLPQSAHFALQLPFVIFGLGPMPNFVDKITVAIPQITGTETKKLARVWTQVIPNAQLFVVPNPLEQPSSWFLKLFLTPSHSMLVTGACLLGTCGLVAGIVGALQWKERKEDQKEKKQEAQKFHFDAM